MAVASPTTPRWSGRGRDALGRDHVSSHAALLRLVELDEAAPASRRQPVRQRRSGVLVELQAQVIERRWLEPLEQRQQLLVVRVVLAQVLRILTAVPGTRGFPSRRRWVARGHAVQYPTPCGRRATPQAIDELVRDYFLAKSRQGGRR